MTTATHVLVGPTDTVTVLPDGRVRVTSGTHTVTLEVHDAGTAHLLSEAFERVHEDLAIEKAERLERLAMVEAA